MKILLAIGIFFSLLGCTKDQVLENESNEIIKYQDVASDFNNDGISDILLKMVNIGTADVPQSSGTNIFTISSLDSNLSFLSKTINLDNYWYKENESIIANASSFFSFKYFYAFLYRRNIENGKYISSWTIDENYSNNKYLVFKYNKNQTLKYGWIKINFNISTKQLTIEDYYETTNNIFVVGKK
jgi:hypothetical protein